jgi:DNA-binding CsgD family transcriptional regulator
MKPLQQDTFDLKELLSKRERELMQLMVDGIRRDQIQILLEISYETFKTHRRSILRKLDLPNEMELLRFVLQNDITGKDY